MQESGRLMPDPQRAPRRAVSFHAVRRVDRPGRSPVSARHSSSWWTLGCCAPLVLVASPPLAASSGPNWPVYLLSLLGTFVVGTATALLIQLYIVPRVETRKRREDRRERDVRELGDLLTTQVAERALKAEVGQGLFRDLRQLETEPGHDPRKLAQSREQQAEDAREAARTFEDLLSTRIKWVTGRIEKIAPKAREIKKFHDAATRYRAQVIIAQVVRPEDDDRTDAEFEEAWDKERNARKALLEQVELLADLRHPPVRWRGLSNERSVQAVTSCTCGSAGLRGRWASDGCLSGSPLSCWGWQSPG